MKKVTILDEIRRSWAITVKDVKVYYMRPPTLMFGILFPVALFFTFSVGRNMSPDRLIPVLVAQTVFWSASSIGPVAIPMERRMRTFERFLSAPISLIAILWGKIMAGVIFGIGISTVAAGVGLYWIGQSVSDPIALILGIGLSAMAFSAMGILFASIPTGRPGEVMIPLNFFRIPLMFVSGLFIPLDAMPQASLILAFLSPLTHTLDLIRVGIGQASFFGLNANIGVLCSWIIVFLFVGQMFHKIIMKRE
ncbi:MAG: ABC transporter permease [Dehalococcoidia bacterium]|nr:ABC transporter permease [Dehalococcoidia bacterium]